MRLSNTQAVSRPAFFDRNPGPKTSMYSAGGVAPHASTTRWSYTVPVGRKAWVDSMWIQVDRAAAGTTAGVVAANLNYVPNGGTVGVFGQGWLFNNAVGAVNQVVAEQFGYLGAGDVLSSTTSDGSTGGSIDYTIAAKYTEYDA